MDPLNQNSSGGPEEPLCRRHPSTTTNHNSSGESKSPLKVPVMTEVQYEKVFNDSVHGHIKLHPLCVKIIDTLQFQRLRNLKQLGSAYLVFPAACSNRFEHSLGVAYLAGQMVDALILNCPEVSILPEEKLSVEIAGLCHDLGHGPFSHLWEHFLSDCDVHWRHEDCSVAMLKHLVKVNALESDFERYNVNVDVVAELIMGEGKRLPKKKFLYQIVNNKLNDIDVDKWDYFLRDGQQLNMKISFDYRRLLTFCRLVRAPETGEYVIGFRNKEVVTINDLFRVRADLHLRAYQHPVVKVLELMFVDAFVEAKDDYIIRADGKEYRLHEAQHNMNAMTQLSDHIQYVIQNTFNPNHPARQKLERIASRKLYKLVTKFNVNQYLEGNDPHIKKGEMMHILKDLRKLLNEKIPGQKLCVDAVRLDFGSYENPLKRVIFFKKPSPHESRSELQIDSNATKDLEQILPTQLNFRNKIDFLVFTSQTDTDSSLPAAVEEVCNKNLPGILKMHIAEY